MGKRRLFPLLSLFFSDRDLLDSFYCIYLNCKYSDEKYFHEAGKLNELFDHGDYKTGPFDYDSIIAENIIDFIVSIEVVCRYTPKTYAFFCLLISLKK